MKKKKGSPEKEEFESIEFNEETTPELRDSSAPSKVTFGFLDFSHVPPLLVERPEFLEAEEVWLDNICPACQLETKNVYNLNYNEMSKDLNNQEITPTRSVELGVHVQEYTLDEKGFHRHCKELHMDHHMVPVLSKILSTILAGQEVSITVASDGEMYIYIVTCTVRDNEKVFSIDFANEDSPCWITLNEFLDMIQTFEALK